MAASLRGTSRLGLIAVVLMSASAAWPCAGEPCIEEVAMATIDGGVPVNFQPLVLTGIRTVGSPVQVRRIDGGLVVTQARSAGGLALFVDTALLIEGERYELERGGGCQNFGNDAGFFRETFTVLAPMQLAGQWASLEVADAGLGGVNQYSGASCFQPVFSSFAVFQIAVLPAAGPMLPFFAWDLELAPVDGGPTLPWHNESVGGVLADGGLGRVPNAILAPKRISTVWHACGGSAGGVPVDPGVPAGRYRALLHARLLDTDAGFVTASREFELAECPDAGELTPPVDGGTDAGSPAPTDAGSVDAGSRDAGSVDGGAVAVDAGWGPGPDAQGCGCTSLEAGLLVGALGMLLRRRRKF